MTSIRLVPRPDAFSPRLSSSGLSLSLCFSQSVTGITNCFLFDIGLICMNIFRGNTTSIMSWYSQTADFLSDSFANHRAQIPLLAATGAASFTLGFLLRSIGSDLHAEGKILPSPRSTVLPGLSDEEIRALPLPADVLPGARDVSTPYGSIRVYEWGPEDGPKVLFVHGITTPCIALGGVAHALVDRGCRVMLFDL